MNFFLTMEIRVTESQIKAQDEELQKKNNEWTQGFHEGLKLAYENKLEALQQIQREEERHELQRTSVKSLAR